MSSGHYHHHHQSIGKWFQVHHRETCRAKQSGKEKQRADKAHVHAMVSVARVAAAVAAVAASTATSSDSTQAATKMATAMASATELLASHCVEAAQLAGARHDQVAAAVQAAVGVRSPGDLMTLTAAAATGTQSDGVFVSSRRRLNCRFLNRMLISVHFGCVVDQLCEEQRH
jgi:hypothetical protein